ADVGDVLTSLDRVRILVFFSGTHEDRPQTTIEQQRLVHLGVGTIPVRLHVSQFLGRRQQRLRLYLPRVAGYLRRAGIGLGCLRHSSLQQGTCSTRAAENCPTFIRLLPLKYG